jgi:hypothetical protein
VKTRGQTQQIDATQAEMIELTLAANAGTCRVRPVERPASFRSRRAPFTGLLRAGVFPAFPLEAVAGGQAGDD